MADFHRPGEPPAPSGFGQHGERPLVPASDPGSALAVADDFFLIVLNDRTGKLRLHHRIAAIGIAGGMLAELVFGGHISFGGGKVAVVHTEPPTERVAKQVYGRFLTEPKTTDVRTWLAFFAEIATGLVADRLGENGWIEPIEQRRLLRRTGAVAYRPRDRSQVAWRAMRLAEQLARQRTLDLHDVTLGGLVAATGFIQAVLWNHPVDACQAHLATQLAELRSRWPALHELFSHVHALSGEATLSPRI
ncbi:MAG: GPP34 family phosphoprotein [Dactylosporangium sp.]|nr:GPP34 family phosphoprotein [Dactylosporangium sp.]NNJ62701.1 GPP34 family phosphoprotein [Dactylosporangium sp.]